MSIDKWLEDEKVIEERKRKEEIYKRLPEKEVNNLKKKSIRKIIQRQSGQFVSNTASEEDFLSQIIKFKRWLNTRTYLKGDIDKIAMWIKNLNIKLKKEQLDQHDKKEKKIYLLEEYKKIPPTFLDEKMRLAINTVIKGAQKSSSDVYQLRKIKAIIQEKLKDIKYYKIIKEVIDDSTLF